MYTVCHTLVIEFVHYIKFGCYLYYIAYNLLFLAMYAFAFINNINDFIFVWFILISCLWHDAVLCA